MRHCYGTLLVDWTLSLVESVSVFPHERPESVVAWFDLRYFPDTIQKVVFEIRVYTNLLQTHGCRRNRNRRRMLDAFPSEDDNETEPDDCDCDGLGGFLCWASFIQSSHSWSK